MKEQKNPPLNFLLSLFKIKQGENITGIPRNLKPILLASLLKDREKALIVTKESLMERLYEDISCFLSCVYLFPKEDEIFPSDVISEKREILKRLKENEKTYVVSCSSSLTKKVPSKEDLDKDKIYLSLDDERGFEKTKEDLANIGYKINEKCDEKGLIAVRGGIIDIWPINYEHPVRCEFDGDCVFSLRLFDPDTQISFQNNTKATIEPCLEYEDVFLSSYFEDGVIVLDEEDALIDEMDVDVIKGMENVIKISYFGEGSFSGIPIPNFNGEIDKFVHSVKNWIKNDINIIVCAGYEGQKERMKELVGSDVKIVVSCISSGFSFENTVVVTTNEIFGKGPYFGRKRFKEKRVLPVYDINQLNIGDYAVHANCGIGKYSGIKSLKSCGKIRDFLVLEYKEGDILYIPTERIDLIEKYIGEEEPKITRLGSGLWERTRNRIKKDLFKYAKELIELYAEREIYQGHVFSKDTIWQNFLELGFVWEETEDQIKAIYEIKKDMESTKPMDRLLAGDTGYGKTEVAIRASFKAIMDGMQCAVLVPTTILAHQHYNTWCERMEGFPIKIGLLSRFCSQSDIKATIEGLKQGSIDIVIGTHRLLSNDISFKNLGLIIIDEEQRFGVMQKEKLKNLKKTADCLSISATPIPRTLYLGLSGIRKMSIIDTPPKGRKDIETHILKFSPDVIGKAIKMELERDGQIFFVHNDIETINNIGEYIKFLIPGIRIGIAHGKLKEDRLEKVMIDFLNKKIDCLVSTSIIESGLDIPSANTIIVNSAQNFGLADLYQIRGRVGRSYEKAYCYFLYPDKRLKEKEKERLSRIKEFCHLGSSYSLALSDLQMRGCGNILGKEQSGNIKAIGLSLWTKLLSMTICKIKGIEIEEKLTLPFDIPDDAYIPKEYIGDERERFNIYKKLSSGYPVEKLRDEIRDRFGKIPEPTLRLFEGYKK
ncbi:TPA: transcription-repair coupling factor [bacterium]|nr:transcription-repair coupling factor [bacterium]